MAELVDPDRAGPGSRGCVENHHAGCPWGPAHHPPPRIVNMHDPLRAAEN
jgi:hypothetical protein